MGNAPQSAREQGPHVAPPVDQDGLAQVIEQHALV
jgi:hydroxymethylpyrimidine pyrophosphatase-like HAD family hydrolase